MKNNSLKILAAQQKAVVKFISLDGAGEPTNKLIRKQLKGQPSSVLKIFKTYN